MPEKSGIKRDQGIREAGGRKKWDKSEQKIIVFRLASIENIMDTPVRTGYPQMGQISPGPLHR
jgi:hypothetical protein